MTKQYVARHKSYRARDRCYTGNDTVYHAPGSMGGRYGGNQSFSGSTRRVRYGEDDIAPEGGLGQANDAADLRRVNANTGSGRGNNNVADNDDTESVNAVDDTDTESVDAADNTDIESVRDSNAETASVHDDNMDNDNIDNDNIDIDIDDIDIDNEDIDNDSGHTVTINDTARQDVNTARQVRANRTATMAMTPNLALTDPSILDKSDLDAVADQRRTELRRREAREAAKKDRPYKGKDPIKRAVKNDKLRSLMKDNKVRKRRNDPKSKLAPHDSDVE